MTVGDSRILLPDVTSCSDFRHALFDCYVDPLSTSLLVLSLHVVFSISALLYSALAKRDADEREAILVRSVYC